MKRATHVFLQLARFDQLRANGGVAREHAGRALFCNAAADTRAAGTEPASQQAFAFAIIAYHESAESARAMFVDRDALAPWLREARETWAGVLRPYRHKGEANFIDPTQPGPQFAEANANPPPEPGAPIVSITTVGWVVHPALDMARVRDFSTGVQAVRMSMTAVPGLHSQQSFFFPNGLEYDPTSITFWRSQSAMTNWAYGPNVHKLRMDWQNEHGAGDRTSFTRCTIVESAGTWHGSSPGSLA